MLGKKLFVVGDDITLNDEGVSLLRSGNLGIDEVSGVVVKIIGEWVMLDFDNNLSNPRQRGMDWLLRYYKYGTKSDRRYKLDKLLK